MFSYAVLLNLHHQISQEGKAKHMEKKPFLTLQQAQEISKNYPTPFNIYDEK